MIKNKKEQNLTTQVYDNKLLKIKDKGKVIFNSGPLALSQNLGSF